MFRFRLICGNRRGVATTNGTSSIFGYPIRDHSAMFHWSNLPDCPPKVGTLGSIITQLELEQGREAIIYPLELPTQVKRFMQEFPVKCRLLGRDRVITIANLPHRKYHFHYTKLDGPCLDWKVGGWQGVPSKGDGSDSVYDSLTLAIMGEVGWAWKRNQ